MTFFRKIKNSIDKISPKSGRKKINNKKSSTTSNDQLYTSVNEINPSSSDNIGNSTISFNSEKEHSSLTKINQNLSLSLAINDTEVLKDIITYNCFEDINILNTTNNNNFQIETENLCNKKAVENSCSNSLITKEKTESKINKLDIEISKDKLKNIENLNNLSKKEIECTKKISINNIEINEGNNLLINSKDYSENNQKLENKTESNQIENNNIKQIQEKRKKQNSTIIQDSEIKEININNTELIRKNNKESEISNNNFKKEDIYNIISKTKQLMENQESPNNININDIEVKEKLEKNYNVLSLNNIDPKNIPIAKNNIEGSSHYTLVINNKQLYKSTIKFYINLGFNVENLNSKYNYKHEFEATTWEDNQYFKTLVEYSEDEHTLFDEETWLSLENENGKIKLRIVENLQKDFAVADFSQISDKKTP